MTSLQLEMAEVIHLLACVIDRDITREGGWILGSDREAFEQRHAQLKVKLEALRDAPWPSFTGFDVLEGRKISDHDGSPVKIGNEQGKRNPFRGVW
jgi:hypothetical protein